MLKGTFRVAGFVVLSFFSASGNAAAGEIQISEPSAKAFGPANSNVFCTGYGPPLETDDASLLSPVLVRWGGNTSSRFNFKVGNIWNAGADWHFANVTRGPKDLWERWIKDHRDAGERVIFTIPILGWLAKDAVSRGNPQKPNPGLTSVRLTDADIRAVVRKIRDLLPHQERIYPLDNEPFQWHHIHGDAVAHKVKPQEFARRWLHVARIVREVDKDAVLTGPGLWGWGDLQNLEPFLEGVLGQSDARGRPLLNVVAAGLYPQNKRLLADLSDITGRTKNVFPDDDEIHGLRVSTTANLDDEEYRDPSWIDAPVAYVPTILRAIDKVALKKKISPAHKPKIGIAEYNWGGHHTEAGAAAQALLILKALRLPLHHMCSFTWPPPHSLAGRTFRALRETIVGEDAKKTAWSLVEGQSSLPSWAWFKTQDMKLAFLFVAQQNGFVKIPTSVVSLDKKGVLEFFDAGKNVWQKREVEKTNGFMAERYGLFRWRE